MSPAVTPVSGPVVGREGPAFPQNITELAQAETVKRQPDRDLVPMQKTLFMAAALLAAVPVAAQAQTGTPGQKNAQAWSAEVVDASGTNRRLAKYEPLARAEKPWNICVLFPHLKDSFWVAVAYGVVSEAERQNVSMTLYEAGGYSNLPRQLSQFDDCVAAKADAIVVGAISEAGLAQKIAEARKKGIPVIGTVNPIQNAETTGKMFVDFPTMSGQTGRYLTRKAADGAKVVAFPGPAGSGWAEAYAQGFKDSLKDSKVEVLDTRFGDTGVNAQLQLVQDALQAYPDLTVLWGTAPTAEAAIGAVAEVGREKDVMILSTYENQAMLDALNAGKIIGFATQYPVLQGRVGIDMAVRALQKQPVMAFAQPVPAVITQDTMKAIDMGLVLAPASWRPVFSVKATP